MSVMAEAAANHAVEAPTVEAIRPAPVVEPAARAVPTQRHRMPRDMGAPRTLHVQDLALGQMYKGVVMAIIKIGAFINIGARQDGFLHVSQISTDFVSNVTDRLSVGDEVEVSIRTIEPDCSKFAVTMIPRNAGAPQFRQSRKMGSVGESSGRDEPQSGRSFGSESDGVGTGAGGAATVQARKTFTRSAPPSEARRRPVVKVGDVVVGKVVNVAAFGAFVDVGDGSSGLLHFTEMMMPEGVTEVADALKPGQMVEVLVTSIKQEKRGNRGVRIGLTMRSKGEVEMDKKLKNAGLKTGGEGDTMAAEQFQAVGQALMRAGIDLSLFPKREVPSHVVAGEASRKQVTAGTSTAVESYSREAQIAVEEEEGMEQDLTLAAPVAEATGHATAGETEVAGPGAAAVSSGMEHPHGQSQPEDMPGDLIVVADDNPGSSVEAVGEAMAGRVEGTEESVQVRGPPQECSEEGGPSPLAEKAARSTADGTIWSFVHGSKIGVLLELTSESEAVAQSDEFKALASDLAMQIAACTGVDVVHRSDVPIADLEREREIESGKEDLQRKPEKIRAQIVEGRLQKYAINRALLEQPFIQNTSVTVQAHLRAAATKLGEVITVRRFIRYNLGEGIAARSSNLAAEVEAQVAAMSAGTAPAAAAAAAKGGAETSPSAPATIHISPLAIKELRAVTGAGVMACKQALQSSGGDQQAAIEALRKKGLASAEKKAGRIAAEGVIGACVCEEGRTGVIVEVNCESDFVARGEVFRELVADLANQLAALDAVQYVNSAEVPVEIRAQMDEIHGDGPDAEGIRAKNAEGHVAPLIKDSILMEQAFYKDSSMTVGDVIKGHIAKLGENIQIRRFTRYELGEQCS